MIRVLLLSRQAHLAVGAVVALGALSALFGRNAIVINLTAAQEKTLIPFPELCALVCAVLLAILLRPRFWAWDRLGTRRSAVVSGCAALAGTTLPIAVAAVGAAQAPDGVPWTWVLANTLVLSSVVLGLTPLAGPLGAGLGTILLYLTLAVIAHLAPDLSDQIPLTFYPDSNAQWPTAVALLLVALGLHARLRGATRLAQRISREG